MERNEKQGLEAVRHFAELAGIDLSDARLERVAPRVEGYFEGIEQLRDVDITEAEPLTVFWAK